MPSSSQAYMFSKIPIWNTYLQYQYQGAIILRECERASFPPLTPETRTVKLSNGGTTSKHSCLTLATFRLHTNYILTTYRLYSVCILTSFWHHSGYILTTFWLHSDYILATFWLPFGYILFSIWWQSDHIMSSFCLHSGYILTTYRLHSDWYWYHELSIYCSRWSII